MKATCIQWEVDNAEELENLPSEIELPDGMTEVEEIEDYISSETGYLHSGYVLEE